MCEQLNSILAASYLILLCTKIFLFALVEPIDIVTTDPLQLPVNSIAKTRDTRNLS